MMLRVLSLISACIVVAFCEHWDEPKCLSRFDYDFKMLSTLVELDAKFKTLSGLSDQMKEDQTRLLKKVEEQQIEIDKLQKVDRSKANPSIAGSMESTSTYVRWGKVSCPGNGSLLVYTGYVGGSHYSNTGAAVDYLCLPKDPIWNQYGDTQLRISGLLYGAEYELDGRDLSKFFGRNLREDNVPCAVCSTRRSSVLMIPGRNRCYDGWTLEYHGYLTSGYQGHNAASQYVCLDGDPESLPNSANNNDGKLFYFVEARCGSLPCPPYIDGRELTCAVCSK